MKQWLTTYSTDHFCDGVEYDTFEEARAMAIEWLIECMHDMFGAIGMPETWTESQKEEWDYMIESTCAYVEKRTEEDPNVLWENYWDPTDQDLEQIGWISTEDVDAWNRYYGKGE